MNTYELMQLIQQMRQGSPRPPLPIVPGGAQPSGAQEAGALPYLLGEGSGGPLPQQVDAPVDVHSAALSGGGPPPAQRPGLLDRIGEKLFAPPAGLEGLLGDDDLKSARHQAMLGLGARLMQAGGRTTGPAPTLTQAIGQSIQGAQGGFQDAMSNAAQFRATQATAQEKGALRQARAAIIAQHPMPDAADRDALAKWIDGVLPEFIRIGDTDTLGKLTEVRKSIEPKPGRALLQMDLGDRVQLVDPTTGQVVREEKKAVTPNAFMHGEVMTPAAAARAEQAIISRFDAQSKAYTTAHEAWSQVDHVLERARIGQTAPDDIVQLLDGISRLNNPGAVVRAGTVKLQLEKIGSWADKLRMWASRGGKGAWPNDIVEGIAKAAREIAQEHAKQYRSLRDRAVKRGKHIGLDYLDEVLPNTWEGTLEPTAPGTVPPPLADFHFGGGAQ